MVKFIRENEGRCARVKKLVIKTICFTLGGIMLLMGLLYGALAIFSPKTLANFFDGIGFERLALKNYEREYNKTEDILDLYELVVKFDEEENAEKCEKYALALISIDNFDTLCALLDGENASVTTKEFVNSKYALSLFYGDKFSDSVNFAKEYFDANGYTSFSPFRVLVAEGKAVFSAEQKQSLVEKLNEAFSVATPSEQALITSDINSLNN